VTVAELPRASTISQQSHFAAGGRPEIKREARLARSPASVVLANCLKSMGAGDHASLAQCYDQIGPMVFALAVRMLRDRQAAEDVTQDIFIQVWRQAANYDTTRGSPEAWIMMIARTRILDRLRSRSAGIVLKPVGENLPDSPDAEDWPDDIAVSREDAVNVRAALAVLPGDQKNAIELAFFDGLTHVEIAEKLGVPLGTIKTRIRLGLLKIKDQLNDISGEQEAEKTGVSQ
jgi:RNA polymerase sigma-70 factor (ECF subfamily)